MICCIKPDIPAPIATKVYCSQRITRLRSAVAYLHHATSAEGLQNNMVSSELSQESIMQLLASSQKGSLDSQTDDLIDDVPSPVDNILRPRATSVGMLRSKYLSKTYSFVGNSVDNSVFVGQSLRTMQQPNGTVPVL
ncbi:hypothetical protein SADUNF_Sadunf10G0032200 [Salix dunnii]|uniref:Uncharacterized protein n=1 Tax=Salix dunnii TaxID=1413687 RepID=A0A835JS46_9ROSI|nr:hypothetical protein SADUNF_Sadunf10G0032200 [Salix dunnii]